MPVVDGVAKLKGKHRISPTLDELSSELVGRETVLVQTVVPLDPLRDH